MNYRLIIKSILPPVFIGALSRILNSRTYFVNNYKTWNKDTFNKICKGYSDIELLNTGFQHFTTALTKPNKYEKDCSLLNEPIISLEFLFSFYKVLSEVNINSKKKKSLRIYDFGGGFGSMFFMHKKIVKDNIIQWTVIEQKTIIELVSNLKNKALYEPVEFIELHEINPKYKPDLLILSSVLQYLEKPYEIIEELIQTKPRFILIERMPFTHKFYEYLKIQKNPKTFKKSSYPIWFLRKEKIISKLNGYNYDLICELKKTNSNELFGGMMLFKFQ